MSPLQFWNGPYNQPSEAQPYGRIMMIITPLITLTCAIMLVAFQLLHVTFAQASNVSVRSTRTSRLTSAVYMHNRQILNSPDQTFTQTIHLATRKNAEARENKRYLPAYIISLRRRT